MATNIVKDYGKRHTFTNGGSAITSGTPVKVGTVSAFLGIALTDIAATSGVGELAIGCEATIAKVSAAVWAAGDQVLWDVTASAVDDNAATPNTGDFLCGTAVNAGANGETTAIIRLDEQGKTVT